MELVAKGDTCLAVFTNCIHFMCVCMCTICTVFRGIVYSELAPVDMYATLYCNIVTGMYIIAICFYAIGMLQYAVMPLLYVAVCYV